MMLALVAAAAALAPVERLYLSYGHRANSFSAAFDPDLERHVTDQGFVAFARHECTRTSLAFFDPVCAEAHMEAVLDSFLEQERQRGRVAFWKVSTATARYLCGRIQSTPEQKPGRAPDMSPAAAAAMKVVLMEVGSGQPAPAGAAQPAAQPSCLPSCGRVGSGGGDDRPALLERGAQVMAALRAAGWGEERRAT